VISSPRSFKAHKVQYIIHVRLASNPTNARGSFGINPKRLRNDACSALFNGGVGCARAYSQARDVCSRSSVDRVMSRVGISSTEEDREGLLRMEVIVPVAAAVL
jgi:hypothetical protein